MNELLKKIDYALRKDSLCDAERIASARFLIMEALDAPAQAAPRVPLSNTFDAIYDALGDVEVDDSGKCRWSDIANIQRAVYQMARDSDASIVSSTNHSPPEDAIKAAMDFAIWSVSGPTNDAEVADVERQIEEAYAEYTAAPSYTKRGR